jgi:hypothetical protein
MKVHLLPAVFTAAALLVACGPGTDLPDASEDLGATEAELSVGSVYVETHALQDIYSRIKNDSAQGAHLWARATPYRLDDIWQVAGSGGFECGGVNNAVGCYSSATNNIRIAADVATGQMRVCDNGVCGTNKWQVTAHELVHAAGYNPHNGDAWRVGEVCKQLGVCCPKWTPGRC